MNQPICFSFGEPVPVLHEKITDYLGVFLDTNHDYFNPPIALDGLARIQNANAHHSTALYFKRNMIGKHYIDNPVLPKSLLRNAAFEHVLMGQSYYQRIENAFGKTQRLLPIPGINMRRMNAPDQYCLLRPNQIDEPIIFKPGEIIHLKDYDPKQSIYGTPEYLAAIQSALLNEGATLFRRKYYENGAHMGFIFYTADADFDPDDEKELQEQIRNSKGAGNFRSMFLNVPGGRPDSVKVIPIGDVATKDEFERIKNISRNDVISMHRIPPALAGVMPENTGGFGDIEKISSVYFENEVIPMRDIFLALNQYLPRNRKIGFSEINQR